MDNDSLNQFIKKALQHYDNQNLSNKDFLNVPDSNIKFSLESNTITFIVDDKEKTFDFEMLGYFDNQSNIWIWAWLLTNLNSEQTKLSRELLNYGLKLEPTSNSIEHFFIKSLLVNSRLSVEEDVQLDTNLAICSYIIKNKIIFIYPRKRFIDKSNNYVTFYYLIK
jgi:hypothetical protein